MRTPLVAHGEGHRPVLSERQNELSSLRESLRHCLEGNGRMTLISGGLASGKTELLQTFSDIAHESGALVLSATGERTESTLQFGAIWQLVYSSPLLREVKDKIARFIKVAAAPAQSPDMESAGDDRRLDAHTSHVVCEALLKLSLDHPLVLCVDDVQFIDHASFQILLSLRRRIRSARILIVLTERTRPHPSRPLFHAEAARQPHSCISLKTLPVADIIEKLAQHMSTGRAAELAPEMSQLSGGNPLLVQALVEDQVRGRVGTSDRDEHRLALGAAYRQAVLDCLYRWDPVLFEIACGLAMLGAYGTPELVTRLLGRTHDSVRQGFAVLTEAGLLVDERFRHPEIATTVQSSTSPEDTAHLHARAAELLYEHGAEATEVARHLVASDTAPNSWALRVLRQAAAQAIAGDDVELAVHSLELALRECADDSGRLAIQSTLVEVAWRVNPSSVARYVAPLHEAMCTGNLTHRDAVPVIRHLHWQGDFAAATKPFETVTGSNDPADARPIAELELSYTWIRGRPHDRTTQRLTAANGAGAGPLVDNAWTRAAAVLHSPWHPHRGGKPVSGDEIVCSAEHILQGRLGDMTPEAGAMALLALDYAGRTKRALFWCDTLLAEAAPKRTTTWQAVLGSVRADLLLQTDLAAAADQANRVIELLHTQSWGVLIGFPLSTLILAHTAMGRLEAAAELLDQVVPDAMFDTIFGSHYLHASGQYQLAAGDPFAALTAFERCRTVMQDRGFGIATPVAWRIDLAQAHLALGQQHKARALLLEQLDRRGAEAGARTRGTALRVLAAAGQPGKRVTLLRESVELLERCGDRLELARALTDLSQAHRELGELADARLLARRADQETKACHAQLRPAATPRRAASPPKQTPLEQQASAGAELVTTLSDAERKVAALAHAGHTNRDIGRQLYITVSTVEQHLTQVYRKLNVHRRTDLPAQLANQ
ncbi:AAA family ATPase [Streptomyces tendae]|uniref:AAA family ATPase n=1 Tax=Streptomyces tendae TaxID=1932 RepID=UPI00372203C2